MRQTLGCAVVLALVVGCGKAKPPRTSAITSPGTSVPTTPAGSGKSNLLVNVLKPRATFKTGAAHDSGAFNPVFLTRDGSRLAVGLESAKKTQIWDLGGEPKKLHDLPGIIMAYSPDGKRYLRDVGINRPEVADAETGTTVSTLEENMALYQFRSAATLVGTGMGAEKQTVVCEYDTATGKVTSSFVVRPAPIKANLHFRGEVVVLADPNTRKVEIWNATAKQRTRELTLARGKGTGWVHLAVSPDGKWMSAGVAGADDVFDAGTGAIVTTMPNGTLRTYFVPGRDLIAATAIFNDDKLNMHQGYVVYDFLKNESRAFLPGEAPRLVFSGDGKVAVTYTAAGDLKVWDLSQVP